MRRRRRSLRRRRNLVLCVLLALSSFVEILRGIPLNEFFDGWGVKLQACVFVFLTDLGPLRKSAVGR
jgi:hypothetical protein